MNYRSRANLNDYYNRRSVADHYCQVKSARIAVIGVAAGVCALVIALRLSLLQTTQHNKWIQVASKQHKVEVNVQGARGTIYDRHGRVLSSSVASLAVGVHPRNIKNTKVLAEQIADLVDVRPSLLVDKMKQDKSFVWVGRGVPKTREQAIKSLGHESISVFPEFTRYQPQGSLASSLIGVVGRDGKGLSGIELAYDKYLSATDYQRALRRDARGNHLAEIAWGKVENVSTVAERAESSRKEGASLVLTIDSVMQDILERELERGAEISKARKAFGVLLDANNGEILAMAQADKFNPNSGSLSSPKQLYNAAIQYSFEPGSTIKPLVAAAVLQNGAVGRSEVLDCGKGVHFVGRHRIRDVHPVGVTDLRGVLVQSSNVCMAKLGARLDKQGLHSSLSSLGFGKRSGIELHGEANGILRPASAWRKIDVATASFGQGVAVTALQLARAYATLANGGLLVNPHLVKGSTAMSPERVFDADVSDAITEMILGVTEDDEGTAKRARIEGVRVYGKTGTAQKAKKNGRGYEPDTVLSSFVGFVRGFEIGIERSLVMLIVVDEPGVMPRWGGVVAAPIFRRAMERILTHEMTVNRKLKEELPGDDEIKGWGIDKRLQTVRASDKSFVNHG